MALEASTHVMGSLCARKTPGNDYPFHGRLV